MKIYFTTSARGDEQIFENSKIIYNKINKLGHTHLDNFLNDMNISKIYNNSFKEKKQRYLNAMNFIRNSDIVILEISTHSLTMGYLLNAALEINKPTILLHIKDHMPAFAEGIENTKLQVWEYNQKDIEATLKEALQIAKKESSIRFNLLIFQDQFLFLQEKAKNRKINKSQVIRELIDQNISKNLASTYEIE